MSRQSFSESYTGQYPWENVAALTAAEAKLGGDELSSVYIDALATAKCGIYAPKPGQVAFETRARSDGDEEDANIIEMYAAAKDIVPTLHYRHIATLTFTQGLGEWWPDAADPAPATIFFSDELAKSANDWISTDVDCGVDASADYASYVINTHGYYKFAFIMSTKDASTTTLYLDVRRF